MEDGKKEIKIIVWIFAFFMFAYFMPIGSESFDNAVFEALSLTKWYAQEHVILCLIPAFFIAGVIAVFVSQASVIKYFGANAAKWKSYSVASVSGAILAVCSCTILPLFSSIHKRGAGLGPAIAFLYSGPAINILAIVLTARILGWELGVARVIGAVVFSIVIGLIMSFIYRKEEAEKAEAQMQIPDLPDERPFYYTAFHFFVLVFILIFATWGASATESGFFHLIYIYKWWLVSFFGLLLCLSLIYVLKMETTKVIVAAVPIILLAIAMPEQPLYAFSAAFINLAILAYVERGAAREWVESTWGFTKQIMPLLGAGVLIAGFLLGGPDGQGIIPSNWVSDLVGGNSIFANFFASIFGAFMYFATLTEVPIIQGLLNSGMGKGPALSLLLAGPALSLPNMLVIRSVMGTKKTLVYVVLVVFMSTLCGLLFGSLFE